MKVPDTLLDTLLDINMLNPHGNAVRQLLSHFTDEKIEAHKWCLDFPGSFLHSSNSHAGDCKQSTFHFQSRNYPERNTHKANSYLVFRCFIMENFKHIYTRKNNVVTTTTMYSTLIHFLFLHPFPMLLPLLFWSKSKHYIISSSINLSVCISERWGH